MALNKRERILLVTTITLIVLAANYFFVLPLGKRWSTIDRDLKNQRRELQAVKDTIARIPEWRQEYDGLKANLGQVADRFQRDSDVLKKIEEVGAASGILINQRRSLPMDDRGVYRQFTVQCNIEATTESLVKFLHALQTGAGFMSVEQLQVSIKGDNPNILRCDVQVRALAGKSGAPAS